MQGLIDSPRNTLTGDQVKYILSARNLRVQAGCDRLGFDLSWQEDMSSHLIGGSVSRTMYADIHGTCTLAFDKAYNWGLDLFRPYMILTDMSIADRPYGSARFNLGVFSLATPETEAQDTARTCTGYDRLYYLNRSIGAAYVVNSGTDYLAAMRQVISDAGLSGTAFDGTATGKTLPQAMVWPLIPLDGSAATDTTYLRVINDLAAAIGYRGVWCDENGLFRSEPYVAPISRNPEATLDSSASRTLVGMKRTMTNDVFAAPNRWVFIQQNRADVPTQANGGIYIRTNQSSGPASIDQRHLTWTKTARLNAADSAALQAQGDRIVAADMATATTFQVVTGPYPRAGHFDVIDYIDPNLFAGTTRVVATKWEQNLHGTDMSWTLESA